MSSPSKNRDVTNGDNYWDICISLSKGFDEAARMFESEYVLVMKYYMKRFIEMREREREAKG
jgi:hypothetical protein